MAGRSSMRGMSEEGQRSPSDSPPCHTSANRPPRLRLLRQRHSLGRFRRVAAHGSVEHAAPHPVNHTGAAEGQDRHRDRQHAHADVDSGINQSSGARCRLAGRVVDGRRCVVLVKRCCVSSIWSVRVSCNLRRLAGRVGSPRARSILALRARGQQARNKQGDRRSTHDQSSLLRVAAIERAGWPRSLDA